MLSKTEKKEILNVTKDIVKAGWCRHEYKKANRYCTIGALAVACGGKVYGDDIDFEDGYKSANYYEMIRFLETFINDPYEMFSTALFHWNDEQPSKKPVIQLLEKAIASL